MAEGLAKNLGLEKRFQIHSAGVEAHGLNPKAVQVMKEINIDISNQESTAITNNELFQYDIIITLCGDARDRCPLPSNNKNIHWGLEDPAKAIGSEEEVINIYRKVRDQISNNIKSFIL